MEYLDVNPNVIMALNNLQDDKENGGRCLVLAHNTAIIHLDAICIVSFLHGLWFQEQSGGGSLRTKSLCLHCREISDQAVAIFGNLLQQPSNKFSNLSLSLPSGPTRRLLGDLQKSSSVKEMHVDFSRHDEGEEEETVERLAELLRHKNDFEALDFGSCEFVALHILPCLRLRGHLMHLRKLRFDDFGIHDDNIESFFQALVDGGHNLRIKELDLQVNDLSPDGLAVLGRTLVPASFRCLETLRLGSNSRLLDNVAITHRFIQQVLSAPGTTLKALVVRDSSSNGASHALLFKSVETNHILHKLGIFLLYDVDQAIRNQLVESLPNIRDCGTCFAFGK